MEKSSAGIGGGVADGTVPWPGTRGERQGGVGRGRAPGPDPLLAPSGPAVGDPLHLFAQTALRGDAHPQAPPQVRSVREGASCQRGDELHAVRRC